MSRILLRAELTLVDTLLTYALDLKRGSVFVVTDWRTPPGTQLQVRLSFLDLVEPIDLVARVVAIRNAGNPGDQPGVELAIDDDPRIDILLARLESAAAAPTTRKGRVLLVEDSSFTRDMFDYGLVKGTNYTFEVEHAETAERAWLKLEAEPFDLVIVDYFLPAETGAKLIDRMRGDSRFIGLPVLGVSIGGRGACDAMMAAGADLYVDKPLVLRELATTVKAVMMRYAPRRTAQTILVFDDSPIVLGVTRSALESAGYRVEVATTMSTFEQQREASSPDLILLDVQMPEVFGDDVAVTLREWHDVRVPILLFSSLPEKELAKRAHDAEADGYITKAAGMPALVKRCKELLALSPR